MALGGGVLGHLGAAGHANIYLDLSQASTMAAPGLTLLRPRVNSRTADGHGVGQGTTASHDYDRPSCRYVRQGHWGSRGAGRATHRRARGRLRHRPIVERAEAEEVAAHVLDHAGAAIAASPENSGQQQLRAAALMMIQGPLVTPPTAGPTV